MEDVSLVQSILNQMKMEGPVNSLSARKLSSSILMASAMTALMELLHLQMEHSACGQVKEISSARKKNI